MSGTSRDAFNRNVDHEKKAASYIDQFYRGQGWVPDRAVACKQYDLALDIGGGRAVTVEEKFLRGWEDTLLIEVVQDLWTPDWGWLYKCTADHLFWIPCTRTGSFPLMLYAIRWAEFKQWFRSWAEEKPRRAGFHVSDKGWGFTVNVRLDFNVIPDNLYTLFDTLNIREPEVA